MKYTLYGKKLRYNGFKLDAAIIAVCSIIGVSMLAALIFRSMAYWFLLNIICMGCALNILMSVKYITRRYIGRAVICGIIALCMIVVAVLDVIYLV